MAAKVEVNLTELQEEVLDCYMEMRSSGIAIEGIQTKIAKRLGKNQGQISKIFKTPGVARKREEFEKRSSWRDAADVLSLDYITKMLKDMMERAHDAGDISMEKELLKITVDVVNKFGEDKDAYFQKVRNMSSTELLQEIIEVIGELTGKPYIRNVVKSLIEEKFI